MLNLKYSLVIEATQDPEFFGFYSPDLEGFSGSGTSLDDCLKKAEIGIEEHLQLLTEQGLPIPPVTSEPTVIISNTNRIVPAA